MRNRLSYKEPQLIERWLKWAADAVQLECFHPSNDMDTLSAQLGLLAEEAGLDSTAITRAARALRLGALLAHPDARFTSPVGDGFPGKLVLLDGDELRVAEHQRADYLEDLKTVIAKGAEVIDRLRVRKMMLPATSAEEESAQGTPASNAVAKSKPAAPQIELFIFASDGDGFYVEGFGESGHFSKMKGFEHISKLIHSPREGKPMATLIGADKDDRAAADAHSKQPTYDKDELRELQARLATAKADQEKAADENDSIEVTTCQEEIDWVTLQIREATGFQVSGAARGKVRDLNNPLDKMRPRIHSALRRAYQKFRNAKPPMKRLAEHFEMSISSESGCFVYRPAVDSPPWSFEPPGEK